MPKMCQSQQQESTLLHPKLLKKLRWAASNVFTAQWVYWQHISSQLLLSLIPVPFYSSALQPIRVFINCRLFYMAMTMTSTESHKNAYSLTLQINSHLDLQLKMPHILPLESLKIPHSKGEMLTLVMGCSLCPPLIFFKLSQKKKKIQISGSPGYLFPFRSQSFSQSHLSFQYTKFHNCDFTGTYLVVSNSRCDMQVKRASHKP